MKIIRSLTWQNMKNSRSRTIVTILGIILSAAMFTAVTTMGVSFREYMMESEIAQYGDYFVRFDYGTQKDLQGLQASDKITKLGSIKTLGYTNIRFESDGWDVDDTLLIGAADQAFFEMMPVGLEEGRLPENGSELAVAGEFRDYLQAMDLPHEIGQQVTLSIAGRCDTKGFELPGSDAVREKTYTIVGITGYRQYFEDGQLSMSSLLTFDDGSEPWLWGRFFAKTAPRAAYALAEEGHAPSCSVNENLLEFYGITKYTSMNDLIVTFAAILIGIIMVGSVSLIYNAFSISVSERTKQFGLLSSVGATRKQIRQSVFTEAMYLGLVGIPLGIFSGYMGIAVTLKVTHGMIDDLLLGAVENGLILKAVPSIPAFAAAGVVALVTVLISAWIPAYRATRIPPISAIRQTQEYKIPKRGIRAGAMVQKVFGLPSALARKYYTVNKRKYRATVISLTISMVLFVIAGTFVQQLTDTAQEQSNVENFDFRIQVDSQEQIDQLRSHPAVKDSAVVVSDWKAAFISEADFTENYKAAWELIRENYNIDVPIESKRVKLEYLEDSVLRSFLKAQGLDPELYLDADDPLAIVPDAQLTLYLEQENGSTDRKRFREQILKNSVEELALLPAGIPTGVIRKLGGAVYDRGIAMVNGVPVLTVMVQEELENGDLEDRCYDILVKPLEDGKHFAYYISDPETGKVEQEPADVVSVEHSRVRIGAAVQEFPMGIAKNADYDMITVILPLSAAKFNQQQPCLMVSVTNYEEFLAFLEKGAFSFADYLASQIQYRDYITIIRIFSYGFIILISLICVCNVFNTISTNISLRRKDFGMLRSVGMKNGEINRMMAFECLQYGIKALLWGIPLSILTSAMLLAFTGERMTQLPVWSLGIASCGIFVTVFITMFYAVSKIRKQNPIEAIRTDG